MRVPGSRLAVKAARDLSATLYDDLEFRALSLPRLAFFVSIWCMVAAWIAEQFFGRPFGHFAELVGFVGTSAASYVGKKVVERPKGGDIDEPPG